MDDETCYYTGMDRIECPCLWCSPPLFIFKYMLVDYQIDTIDDVIAALEDRLKFFEQLKKDGFRLMGPVEDYFAEFEPPESEEYYWVRCRSCGDFLKIDVGTLPRETCPMCGKNVYKYEE